MKTSTKTDAELDKLGEKDVKPKVGLETADKDAKLAEEKARLDALGRKVGQGESRPRRQRDKE